MKTPLPYLAKVSLNGLLDYTRCDPVSALANPFLKPSSLKDRIAMLYKNRNSKWVLGKYLAVVILAGFVAASMAFKPAIVTGVLSKIASTVKVKGVVVNNDGEPLSNFLVKVADARMVFLTDNLGRYEAIIPSDSKLVFNSKNYKSVDVRVKDDQVVNAILTRLESTDSSVVLVYPWTTMEKVHPGQDNFGQLIPRFYDDLNPPKPGIQEWKLRFLGHASEAPAFPGGLGALREFVGRNATYPVSATRANVQGKTLIRFVVSAAGEIQDVKILKSPKFGLEETSKRLMSAMPTWIPGQKDGKKIATPFTLTIDYRLATD